MNADNVCSPVLFVGGVRSGKSSFALNWAEKMGKNRVYLATARIEDGEMEERVKKHRSERGVGWEVVEEPLLLEDALRRVMGEGQTKRVILLDCISSWISNLLAEGVKDTEIVGQVDSLCALVGAASCPLGIVSLEVGLGLVPMNALGRRYLDLMGLGNQKLAQVAQTVLFFSCGLPMVLKGGL